ncbi:MAG: PQQ-binding-like beta-propeller repeat protein [Lentisphaeria bacterium]|nr:PQQ-like beta-propeller repeat protein [Lentisphaeria bacterium]NQZ70286.1 PQQ-binding-like beta-propeller repeat protein [Lentisphaeria bacterium]
MEKIFIGMSGRVACLNQEDGEVIWEVQLKSLTSLTNIYRENGCVFAYAGGHLFCLDDSDGSIKWTNKLKGFGYGACLFAGDQQNSVIIEKLKEEAGS